MKTIHLEGRGDECPGEPFFIDVGRKCAVVCMVCSTMSGGGTNTADI